VAITDAEVGTENSKYHLPWLHGEMERRVVEGKKS